MLGIETFGNRELSVTGLSELQRQLVEFPAKVQRKMLRKALRAGAKPVREIAQALVPVRTGMLKRNIVVRAKTRRGVPTVTIGLKTARAVHADTKINRKLGRVGKSYNTRGPAYYGRYVELGRRTRPMKTTPFLAPALEQGADRAVAEFARVMREEITAEYGH